jgi:hypothetical protein
MSKSPTPLQGRIVGKPGPQTAKRLLERLTARAEEMARKEAERVEEKAA